SRAVLSQLRAGSGCAGWETVKARNAPRSMGLNSCSTPPSRNRSFRLAKCRLRFRLLFRVVEAPDEMMRNRRRLQACATDVARRRLDGQRRGNERVGNGAAI